MYTVCVYVSACVCLLDFRLITALHSLASENSNVALSTYSFSDQTLDLGPISLSTNQSGEILFTCCRWDNDISKRERVPALQVPNHDGNQVRRHWNLGAKSNPGVPKFFHQQTTSSVTSTEEKWTDRLSEPIDDTVVVLRVSLLSVPHCTHHSHQIFRYRHLWDDTQGKRSNETC